MKFSWKICISTMAGSMLIAGLGGYVLLSALFQSAWQRETEAASEENRMLQYSFAVYWNMTAQEGGTDTVSSQGKKTARAMADGMAGTELRFRLYDGKGTELFSSESEKEKTLSEEEKELLLAKVSENTRGRMLVSTEDGYELVTTGSVRLQDGTVFYLESDRNVTELLENRKAQYGVYLKWMAGLLLVQALVSYFLAVWLLRPLRRLSRATRRIAAGNMEVRARVETGDEIGDLAADFNHMADNLERQFAELEDAARRQEDFIGSFAHEIKTPLTSMIGYADMLRSREMNQEERFEAANYIFREGKRLEALSFKLLDLMVIRHSDLKKTLVDTKWMAESIEGFLKPSLEERKISLRVLAEQARIPADPDLLKTVLLNLLDNGRKATEAGGEIFLLGRREDGGYAFYVRDTGKGMEKEELSRITEAFYMVDKSRARKQGGAGLGLSLCVEIVKRHGGKLNFRSERGKGTIVRVWLPEGDFEEGGEKDAQETK